MSGLASRLPLSTVFSFPGRSVAWVVLCISESEMGVRALPPLSVSSADSMTKSLELVIITEGGVGLKRRRVKWEERPHLSDFRSESPYV